MSDTIYDEVLDELKKRAIFSEYLPEGFCVRTVPFDIYNLQASADDHIKPYMYSMSRFRMSGERRTMGIPEIAGYVSLIAFLVRNNDVIETIVNKAAVDENSFSRIVDSDRKLMEEAGGYAVNLVISHDADVSRDEEKLRSVFIRNMETKIDRSKGACGILHIDLAEFYSSIYTHTIASIKIGLEEAERQFAMGKNYWSEDYKVYNNLDKHIRKLNRNRTNGLLTGPYISKVIAEAILSNVDEDFRKKDYIFSRYADDYEFAVYDESEQEKMKEEIEGIFEKYSLRMNREKTRFEKYPFYIFSNFKRVLTQCSMEEKGTIDVLELFNRFWEMERDGEKGAILYLLRTYGKVYNVQEEDTTYINYLINVLCNDEKALVQACHILIEEYRKGKFILEEDIKKAIEKKLYVEIKNNHEHEVIWLLYLLKNMNCPIAEKTIEDIIEKNFELAQVLLLHEYRNQMNQQKRMQCFTNAKSWILLYELALIDNRREEFFAKTGVSKNQNFYNKLFDENYSFYKETEIG